MSNVPLAESICPLLESVTVQVYIPADSSLTILTVRVSPSTTTLPLGWEGYLHVNSRRERGVVTWVRQLKVMVLPGGARMEDGVTATLKMAAIVCVWGAGGSNTFACVVTLCINTLHQCKQ